MKLAVISLTKTGSKLAKKISQGKNADMFCKKGTKEEFGVEFDSLNGLVSDIFQVYDGIIFIMATGIVVRIIAPFIVHKKKDPAIVVLDELGNNSISLLSGHLGGANRLAIEVAKIVQANPVITTATDVHNKVAADMVAVDLNLTIASFAMLKQVNLAIANQASVPFFIDQTMEHFALYLKKAQEKQINLIPIDTNKKTLPNGIKVLITDNKDFSLSDGLILSPRQVVIGIGCRKGVTEEEIFSSLTQACKIADITLEQIRCFASTIVKKDETGLLAVCKRINKPIYFYSNHELKQAIDKYKLECSAFVQSRIGVGNVCEAAAMIASQSKKIVLSKTKLIKTTIAIAWEE